MDGSTLDQLVVSLGDRATGEERLEVVWHAYEGAVGHQLARPVQPADRAMVLAWARELRARDDLPMFMAKAPRLVSLLSQTVVEKASTITQFGCAMHRPDEATSGIGAFGFQVGFDPWSAQSSKQKVMIRTAVTEALLAKGTQRLPWGKSDLCLTVTALVSQSSPRKDVDNLAKGLLDALEGYLYENDNQVACLTLRRIEYAGLAGCYLLHAIPLPPWDNDVIYDDPKEPKLAFGRIELPSPTI